MSTRRPGRDKPGAGAASWGLRGIVVNGRYFPPIAGGEEPPAGDQGDQGAGGQGSEGNGNPGDKPKPEAEPKFSQAQVDEIVKDRLAREKAASDRAAEKARREAEEKAAAEAGEHKTLAEKRQERITALEADLAEAQSHKERAERYQVALKAHLDAQRKDLPAWVVELLDGKDVVDQMAWLAKNRDEVVGAKGASGPNPSPRANGHSADQRIKENREKLVATGGYGRL